MIHFKLIETSTLLTSDASFFRNPHSSDLPSTLSQPPLLRPGPALHASYLSQPPLAPRCTSDDDPGGRGDPTAGVFGREDDVAFVLEFDVADLERRLQRVLGHLSRRRGAATDDDVSARGGAERSALVRPSEGGVRGGDHATGQAALGTREGGKKCC